MIVIFRRDESLEKFIVENFSLLLVFSVLYSV